MNHEQTNVVRDLPIDWADTQVLLRHPLKLLPHSALVVVTFCQQATTDDVQTWLRNLLKDITPAEPRTSDGAARSDPTTACNIAWSAAGLARLGLTHDALDTFPPEFAVGMDHDTRAAVLGDRGASAPSNWCWGRTAHQPAHAVLLIYGISSAEVLNFIRSRGLNSPRGPVAGLHTLLTELRTHEPFGFRDGLTNPRIRGASKRPGAGIDLADVGAGEFLFGYPDERGLRPLGPTLHPTVTMAPLPMVLDPEPRLDLGRNGSLLVLRQLRQDVKAFDAFTSQSHAPSHLAARMVGRWKDGTALAVSATRPLGPGAPSNAFDYADDPDGRKCPLGAHVRRANPRAGLGMAAEKSLANTNMHRLLRRGRVYEAADSQDCGLLFACFNTSLSRQFEHVQQTWLGNPRFAAEGEVDPIVGNHSCSGDRAFTSGDALEPRRVTGLVDFVTTVGGGYFFFPGVRALAALADLHAPKIKKPASVAVAGACG